MNYRKIIAVVFLAIAMALGVIFYLNIAYPENILGYFDKSYYGQMGPIAICVELFVGGYYLFKNNSKANFALALFGFTAVLDISFHLTDILESAVPLYGMIVFFLCSLIAFYIAFSNTFNLGKISVFGVLGSFVLGNAIEFFFNFY